MQRFFPLAHSPWGILGFVYQGVLLIVALVAILNGAPGLDGVIAVFVTALIGTVLYLALILYHVLYRATLLITQEISSETYRSDQWHFLTALVGNFILLVTAVAAWIAPPPSAAQFVGMAALVLSVATALVILTHPASLTGVRYSRTATGDIVEQTPVVPSEQRYAAPAQRLDLLGGGGTRGVYGQSGKNKD
jgi:hypothetical protein